jgi:hypothetical protein
MNKALQLLVVISLVVSCYCVRFYTNPIDKSNNPDPGAIYVDELKTIFVAVTTDNNSDVDKFPIRASKITDLTSWPVVAHVFPSSYRHPWANLDFWAPVSKFQTGISIFRQKNLAT